MVALPDPKFTLTDAQSYAQTESERTLRQSIAMQAMFLRHNPDRKDGQAIIDALIFGYEGRFGILPQYVRDDGNPRIIMGQRYKDRILMPVGGTKTIQDTPMSLKRHDPKTGIVMVPCNSGDIWEREDGADYNDHDTGINIESDPELAKATMAFVIATNGGNPEKFIADYLRDRQYRNPISQAEAQV